MARTALQIVDGVLERTPGHYPGKKVLRDRLLIAVAKERRSGPMYHAPEEMADADCFTVRDICVVCKEVLGDPAGDNWTQKIADYLAAGE